MRYPIPDYCTFKTPELEERTKALCDMATEVLDAMAAYCKDRALPIKITDSVSTAAEDIALSRVSDEHRTGRAFDLSVHGWIEVAIVDFICFFEAKYISVAAIGKVSGQSRLILRHNNGHGDHLHVQVGHAFGVKNPLKLPSA